MKRKLISALLALLAASTLAFAQGIGSGKDLADFITACNNGGDLGKWMSPDSTFHFTADIDLAKEKKMPQLKSFACRLCGDGHKILNWKATGALVDELLPGASISGIVIDASCSMKVSSKAEEFFAAFIVNRNHGIVSDCENHGSISHKCNYTSNSVYIGGVVASNRFAVLRCTNFGKIESVCSSVEQKADLSSFIGGVVGGGYAKTELYPTVAWCCNEGTVSVSSDYPVQSIGGVIGSAFAASVKYSVNKGSVVSSTFLSDAEKPLKAQDRVGGVVGFTKGEVLCCDNLGEVHSSGVASAAVGGIVGQPHAALNVTDCVNYGSVTASNENASFVGGIAGNIGRPVHIRRCFNRGTVLFDGVSVKVRSCVAGIVGQVYSPKTSSAGTYVRNCANWGDVVSKASGSAGSGDDAVHAAGIVGHMSTRDDFTAFLYDCANFGNISSTGGRKGNICAVVPKNTTAGGKYPDDEISAAQPMPDGTNVTGRVTDTEGRGLADVVVTDGRQCVATDANGFYSMKSNLEEVHFIYLSLPSTAMAPSLQGIPQFFRRVPRYATAVAADFVLESKPQVDDYTLMMIGDPQVRPSGMDGSMEAWWNVVAPDAEQFRAGQEGEVYCINLGDLVYNYMYAYDDYIDAAAQIKCPTFNVIGNHDFDQNNMFDTSLGYINYENYISPEHYSFNLGRIHFVVVNTIMYDRQKQTESYGYGLDDRTMEWLENDLRYVDKDRVIVACSHAQLFKKKGDTPNGSHGAYSRHYKDYLALLREYKQVYSWSGHYHGNFQYNYLGQDTKWGAPNIQTICVARCTGALRFNQYLGASGEPQGYMVLNVKGDDMEWYYKSVGSGKDYQMRGYSPVRCGDGCVRVNIWNWCDQWTTPEWWENGVKVADMEFAPGIDPDYQDLWTNAKMRVRDRKYCKPQDDAMLFKAVPSEGARSGEVRVIDQFGNEYKTEISW